MLVLRMSVSIFVFDKHCYLNIWVGNECCLVSHRHAISGKPRNLSKTWSVILPSNIYLYY